MVVVVVDKVVLAAVSALVIVIALRLIIAGAAGGAVAPCPGPAPESFRVCAAQGTAQGVSVSGRSGQVKGVCEGFGLNVHVFVQGL